ncbi:MAG: hypothetical protein ABR508_08045 [Candidatus Baltobacteraceae bacterium]
MIVTRRRKKPFPWKRVMYSAAAAAIVTLALWWAPSRTFLAASPVTAPVRNAPFLKPLARPFDLAAQQGTLNAQSAQIDALSKEVNDARSQIAQRDKQITQLQTQLSQAQQGSAVAPASKPAGGIAANPAAAIPVVSADLAQDGTAGMHRTALVWGAMDSEAAAKVVQKLPEAYVARIFALMPPDSVGAILENLPAAYAAQLTQEHPELKR